MKENLVCCYFFQAREMNKHLNNMSNNDVSING